MSEARAKPATSAPVPRTPSELVGTYDVSPIFVLDGLFHIEFDGADTVELDPRQGFAVPGGMLHRPVVPVRSAVLMIERAGVIATGDRPASTPTTGLTPTVNRRKL